MTWDLTSLNDAGSTSLYDLGPHAKIWTDLHRGPKCSKKQKAAKRYKFGSDLKRRNRRQNLAGRINHVWELIESDRPCTGYRSGREQWAGLQGIRC
ncbi:hypothetical protein RRG08_050558 [Elysia crispata]|uniref:Uncharacterized protein n=1 Tax=Elysia crispata TaxID=231223 RepID=A0AAE0Z715_9GAST|nr:hypothetical protein RRG08_050558 [Elysia crispata]